MTLTDFMLTLILVINPPGRSAAMTSTPGFIHKEACEKVGREWAASAPAGQMRTWQCTEGPNQ